MPPREEGEELALADEHVEVPLNDKDEELAKNEIPEDMRPREQEPTFFSDHRGNLKAVNMVVRHPCKIFWLILIMCFGLAFLLQVLVFRTAEGGNPFTAPENEYDLGDERSIQYDSLRLARDEVQGVRTNANKASKTIEKQSEVGAIAYWVFEGETPEGVFGSRESIEAMKDAFDIFWEDEGFKDQCLLDYRSELPESGERECDAPLTTLKMYYASEWDSEKVQAVTEQLKIPGKIDIFNSLALCYYVGLFCDLVEDPDPADIQWALAVAANITQIISTWDLKGELVPDIDEATEFASYLIQVEVFKGQIDFGYDKRFSVETPISMYSRGIVWWGGPLEGSEGNKTTDELEAVDEADNEKRKDFVLDNYFEEMEALAEEDASANINSYYFMTSLIGDVILQIVVQDAALALFSFLFVFIWLRINTGSWFLASVGFFEIFFSIPVSWFIFTVVFQIKYFATLNSLAIFIVAAIGADDIFIFMDAYKQSKYRDPKNLVDLETRMSWVYRRTGTAMGITSATTCAAFLCTLITPLTSIQSFGVFAAVVIFIDYVLVMSLFCTAVVIYHDRYEDRSRCGCCCPCDAIKPSNTDKARQVLEEAGDEPIPRDRISEFFRYKFAPFIENPAARLVLAVLFLAWLGIAIWQATLIEATKEAEQFLNEDNPFQKSITILNSEFPTASEDVGLKVYYTWGLGLADRTGVNLLLDPTNFGEPTYVEEFDFNAQCQTELVSFCEKLKTDDKYKNLIKRKNGIGEAYCFVDEMAAYSINGNLEDCDYVRSGAWKNETWQVDPANLADVMEGFLSEASCFDEDGTESISSRYSNEIGWDGTKLRYAGVSVESNVLTPFGFASEAATRYEYDQFIDIGEEWNSVVSEHCSGEVIVTDLDGKFVFMNNQAIYVQTAVQSSVLGVAIAFVVLLISTRVFHIAFFASLSICSVLVSVVGTMVLLGWNLGSIEAILIGIIAGFSVDYVVHLAHAYEIAEGDTYERVTEAFGDLGISVFNGMITSVAASIPLFFCQLQFFAKFGTFLCLTIAFSWVFANFGFMSILAQLKIPIKHDKCMSC
jgi:hypothetical protein